MPPHNPTTLTVLISGSGTNLAALIAALPTALAPARIARVISNRKAAYGLVRAADAGIPTAYHNLLAYKKAAAATSQDAGEGEGADAARRKYDEDLAALVLADAPDLVVCAGFMHVLGEGFLARLGAEKVPVVNLHPGRFWVCLLSLASFSPSLHFVRWEGARGGRAVG